MQQASHKKQDSVQLRTLYLYVNGHLKSLFVLSNINYISIKPMITNIY